MRRKAVLESPGGSLPELIVGFIEVILCVSECRNECSLDDVTLVRVHQTKTKSQVA